MLLCPTLLIQVKTCELSIAAAKGIPRLKPGSVPYLLSSVAQGHTQRSWVILGKYVWSEPSNGKINSWLFYPWILYTRLLLVMSVLTVMSFNQKNLWSTFPVQTEMEETEGLSSAALLLPDDIVDGGSSEHTYLLLHKLLLFINYGLIINCIFRKAFWMNMIVQKYVFYSSKYISEPPVMCQQGLWHLVAPL